MWLLRLESTEILNEQCSWILFIYYFFGLMVVLMKNCQICQSVFFKMYVTIFFWNGSHAPFLCNNLFNGPSLWLKLFTSFSSVVFNLCIDRAPYFWEWQPCTCLSQNSNHFNLCIDRVPYFWEWQPCLTSIVLFWHWRQ